MTGEFAAVNQNGSQRARVVTESRMLPDSEVREKFRRVNPLKEISITQRGRMPDVLNIVRRQVEERGVHAASSSKPPVTLKRTEVRTPSEFTTADVHVLTRELEKLHPDNQVGSGVWAPGNASRDFDACNRARLLAIALTLNSQRSTFNHFAVSGVCRKWVWSYSVAPAMRPCL